MFATKSAVKEAGHESISTSEQRSLSRDDGEIKLFDKLPSLYVRAIFDGDQIRIDKSIRDCPHKISCLTTLECIIS